MKSSLIPVERVEASGDLLELPFLLGQIQ